MTDITRIASAIFACLIGVAGAVHAGGNAPPSPTLAGQWHGTLQTAAGSYNLELAVVKDAAGQLSASVESIDQAPGQAIPIARIALEDDRLTLAIDAIAATYEGRFDAASHTWRGTWRQGLSLPLTWTRGAYPPGQKIAGIDGKWRATLPRGGKDLRLILHVATTSRGTGAKLDSPDMGVAGLSLTELSRADRRVRFSVPVAGVVFEGALNETADGLNGTWRREGMAPANLTFSRDGDASPRIDARPQTPRAPFGYGMREVTFSNPETGHPLAGTLTMPDGPGPFASAVLISGSGPQDRDETLFGHRPFAVLADHLSRNGVAVLRVDDRGVGKSGGDFATATNLDFASDARAAVRFLAAQSGIAPRSIGLIGHSQGGIVAPIAATQDSTIAFLVLLAAPGTGMGELLMAQRRMAGVIQGKTREEMTAGEPALTLLYKTTIKAGGRKAARARVGALLTPARLRELGKSALEKDALIDEMTSDWLRDVLLYDAPKTLGKLRIPVLALNGGVDQQVPAQANLHALRRALRDNQDATIEELPQLNHMFQTARSGAMAEYAEIAETFAPSALEVISKWVVQRFGGQAVRPAPATRQQTAR
ncbi:alpha/beta hydrolase family protein [Massilia glaciei]|uniref:Peptidase S15 n=1 Tax=Massilia glaciei TaxID=1524097 RepID=A0A2U2HGG8_9BURK|nr:alpha/beta fold hydrolase [Massilia glaciei]PWF44028.1 peptidase S15 [Massilia glaciei]